MEIEVTTWGNSPIYEALINPDMRYVTFTADNGKQVTARFKRFEGSTGRRYFIDGLTDYNVDSIFDNVEDAVNMIESWLKENEH
jgi:hypothetical protein